MSPRAWGRATRLVLLLALHLPLHGIWRALGQPSPWRRRFLRAIGRAAGFDTIVEGTPLTHHVLYASNHVSWIDIVVIAGSTGARFVAKEEVKTWPVIGWLADLNRTIYVARAERGRVQDQAQSLRAALSDDWPVTLFAEGTTGNGRDLLPFRASLFAALLPPQPGVRIQPVAIDYGENAPLVAWATDTSAGAEAARILSLPGRRLVTLRFCAPIDPAAYLSRKDLCAASHAAVRSTLGETPVPTV